MFSNNSIFHKTMKQCYLCNSETTRLNKRFIEQWYSYKAENGEKVLICSNCYHRKCKKRTITGVDLDIYPHESLSVYNEIERKDDIEKLKDFIDNTDLSDKFKVVFYYNYGLFGFPEKTHKEISEMLGMTLSHTRHIINYVHMTLNRKVEGMKEFRKWKERKKRKKTNASRSS